MADADDGPRRIGRYWLHERLAAGGMGSIHLARVGGDAGFARVVAIKRLRADLASNPELSAMFIDEARLAARIRHPNVVPTLDVVAEGGQLFIVMEYVEGVSLADALRETTRRGGRIPPDVCAGIMLGVLHGLHAAHEATDEAGRPLSIVHCDVSPPNVLVGADGLARVLDFGIAKTALRSWRPDAPLRGKPRYFAPEQLEGLPMTRQVDVFAAGAVLWELLVGRPLFAAEQEAVTLAQVLTMKVVPPSQLVEDLPPALDAVVTRALERDTAARFESALAMADALEAALPPASPRRVGAWLRDTAGKALRERAVKVAAIERGASDGAERFELEVLAGTGGMGSVYRALDRRTGETVALKLFDGVDPMRFGREVHVLAELDHPALARYVAHGTLEGRPFVAMQWIEGAPLSAVLERGPLPIAEAVALGKRLATGLAAAHALGIVHRDVKPANVMLPASDPARAVLVDFGVARAVGQALTATGVVIGTPAYMAPEQARGERTVGVQADVHALGCLLFEAVSGRPAFEGDHPIAVLAKVLTASPPPLAAVASDVPPVLSDIVGRMLDKDPAARATMDEVLRALGDALAPAARPASLVPSAARRLSDREQRTLVIVVSLAVDLDPSGATIAAEVPIPAEERALAADAGGTLEAVADGSCVATFVVEGRPADAARRAVRFAGALGRARRRPCGVSMGRGSVVGMPAGPAIDRAVELARAASGEDVVVDPTVAELVSDRFELAPLGSGHRVVGKRAARVDAPERSPWVGRGRELDALRAEFEAVTEERVPRATLLVGGAGVGKSRLAREFVRRLGSGTMRVWRTRGDEAESSSAFAAAGSLLRAAVGLSGDESPAERDRRLRAFTRAFAATEPERAADFLGAWLGAEPARISTELRAARADAIVMGDQLRAAWLDLLAGCTAEEPLVIVVDDLEWCDLATLRLLDAALGLEQAALFVLGLARPELDARAPSLWGERRLTRIALRGLGRRDAEALARALLGEHASGDDVRTVVEAAEGVPYQLEELARARAAGHALPISVLAAAEARLSTIDPARRRALRAASVFGRRAWDAGVAAVAGEPVDAVRARLDALVEEGILVRYATSYLPPYREFEFVHGLQREAAYGTLLPADRVAAHALAAEWLEGVGDVAPAVLAYHAELGELPSASAHHAAAAAHALGGDLAGAIAHAERSLACGAAGKVRGFARRVEAEARFWQADLERAASAADDALTHLAVGTEPWFAAASYLIGASSRLGAKERVRAAVARVRSATPWDEAASAARVQTLAVAANFVCLEGAIAESCALLEEARAAFVGKDLSYPLVAARIARAEAVLASLRGDLGAYIDGTRRTAELFRNAGDLRNAVTQEANLSYSLLEAGAYRDAARVAESAMETAERMGLAHTAALARQNLGYALALGGALEDGDRVLAEAEAAFSRAGHVRLEGGTAIYRAAVAMRRADLPAAEAHARRAVAMLAGQPLRAYALATLARILRATQRPEEARAAADAGLALLDQLGSVDAGGLAVLAIAAEQHVADGAPDAAILVARAEEHGRTRLKSLRDPRLRSAFESNSEDWLLVRSLAERIDAAR